MLIWILQKGREFGSQCKQPPSSICIKLSVFLKPMKKGSDLSSTGGLEVIRALQPNNAISTICPLTVLLCYAASGTAHHSKTNRRTAELFYGKKHVSFFLYNVSERA
jgi:hypothetical protein